MWPEKVVVFMVSLTLPIVTHVTSSLTLQLLALDCVNSIMNKHGIGLGIYETRLVGEIKLSTFPVLVLKNEANIFKYSSVTLHETTREMSGNLYAYQKQLHRIDLNIISYQYKVTTYAMLCPIHISA